MNFCLFYLTKLWWANLLSIYVSTAKQDVTLLAPLGNLNFVWSPYSVWEFYSKWFQFNSFFQNTYHSYIFFFLLAKLTYNAQCKIFVLKSGFLTLASLSIKGMIAWQLKLRERLYTSCYLYSPSFSSAYSMVIWVI